jgi:hypothetical protein
MAGRRWMESLFDRARGAAPARGAGARAEGGEGRRAGRATPPDDRRRGHLVGCPPGAPDRRHPEGADATGGRRHQGDGTAGSDWALPAARGPRVIASPRAAPRRRGRRPATGGHASRRPRLRPRHAASGRRLRPWHRVAIPIAEPARGRPLPTPGAGAGAARLSAAGQVRGSGTGAARPRPAAPSAPAAPATVEPGPPGTLDVATPGGWADVFVAGRRVGRSPCRVSLPAGRHVVELRPFGAATSFRTPVDVPSGGATRLVRAVEAP